MAAIWDPVIKDDDEITPYGQSISSSVAEELFSEGKPGAGIVREIYVLGETCQSPSFVKDGKLKERNPVPVVRASDFFSSLTKTEKKGLWVFSGTLNGWLGLDVLEVIKVELLGKEKKKRATYANFRVAKAERHAKTVWSKGKKTAPKFTAPADDFMRVTVRSAPYTELGYTRNNPGSIWYYSQFRSLPEKCSHGQNVIDAVLEEYGESMPIVKSVHHLVHRYVRKVETKLDKYIYHSAVFVEWNHGNYGTVFELAFKHGMGGYSGKSNWLEHDKWNEMYTGYALGNRAPWLTNKAEIRIIDVVPKNKQEMLDYLADHTEGGKKEPRYFIDGKLDRSAEVGDQALSMVDIARGCVNYIIRQPLYSDALNKNHRSCQTFSADFYQFVSGDNSYRPYSDMIQRHYKSRRDNFGL